MTACDDFSKNVCAECSKPAKQFCSACKSVFYCGRDCQKTGWKSHKGRCKTYTIQNSPIYGRYVVACRDIKAGEVIVKEAPLVVGPKHRIVPLCLGCHKKISTTFYCTGCGFPLCAPSCQTSKYHKKECSYLSNSKGKMFIKNVDVFHPAYECIMPLRCLLTQDDPKKWALINEMQSHVEEIRNTSMHNVVQTNVVDFIRIFLEHPKFDADTIYKMSGILLTNAFEIVHNGSAVRALYYTPALFAHSCVPNTRHVIDEDLNMIQMASQNIPKGAAIFENYTQPLWNTLSRREHLQKTKMFLCSCERCSDPRELESNLSTLICSKCEGSVLSMDPLDDKALWACSRCDHGMEAKQVKTGNELLYEEIRQIGKTEPAKLESFLDRYKGALHSNHRFFVECKYALIQFYGNSASYRYRDLSPDQLKNKVNWCKELLSVASIISPGKSILRGTLLFELQGATVASAKSLLSNCLISEEEAGKYMNEAVGYLQEATVILKMDPEMSKGGLDKKLKWLEEELEL